MDGSHNSGVMQGQALLSALQAQRNQALNQVAELMARVQVLEAEVVRLRKASAPERPIEANGKAA